MLNWNSTLRRQLNQLGVRPYRTTTDSNSPERALARIRCLNPGAIVYGGTETKIGAKNIIKMMQSKMKLDL